MPGINPNFIQSPPVLGNSYLSDELLQSYLIWRLPPEVRARIEIDLKKFGQRCVGEIHALGEKAEAGPPRLVSYSPWGERIDEIEVSDAWFDLHKISAEEGLVAIGYERREAEFSRLHQFAKLYMVHPSSAFYTCPLAMTDGAARVLELSGSAEMKAKAFKNLISRDPEQFWTSGQWMTERTGGSDVSGTSTVARKTDSAYSLSGDKWFTSATTSQMALALAKVEGANDSKEGLSLFYVEIRDPSGRLNSIRINRLKDKLGTKALPTAELTLQGTPATMIGGVGEGVKRVAALLNITRLYNSACALGTIARAFFLAKDYAVKREAFGKPLSQQPLHLLTLARIQAEYEGVFHLLFDLVGLLGKEETDKASDSEKLVLRLMTPVIKLWSAKQSLAQVSEALECFGGAGYIEDTGIPRLLRDAQVFSIWEGTTNVLSLDTLRAIEKDGALQPWFQSVDNRLNGLQRPELSQEKSKVKSAVEELKRFAAWMKSAQVGEKQAAARDFAFALARIHAASLMLEYAEWCVSTKQRVHAAEILRVFLSRPLVDLPAAGGQSFEVPDMSKIGKAVFGS